MTPALCTECLLCWCVGAPDAEQPVFTDTRQSFQALGTQITDISTAARIMPRV